MCGTALLDIKPAMVTERPGPLPAGEGRECARTTGAEDSQRLSPGAIGRIVRLHGVYYASHWGFGAFFEARMARELAEFVDRFDARRDGLWTALVAGRIAGSIAIDGSHAGDGGAHLRWFILDPACTVGAPAGVCSPRRSGSAAAAARDASRSGHFPASMRLGGSTNRRAFAWQRSAAARSGGSRSPNSVSSCASRTAEHS